MELFYKLNNFPLWHINECLSTSASLVTIPNKKEAIALVSFNQTNGVGQANKVWYTSPYNNIAYSALLPLSQLAMDNLAVFNMCISTAIHAFISTYCKQNIYIKWPNDMYIEDKKIGGQLMSVHTIENKKYLKLGIGININQPSFPENLPNATSFYLQTTKLYDLEKLSIHLHETIWNFVSEFTNSVSQWYGLYNKYVWKKNNAITYTYQNKLYKATVIEVNMDGQYVLLTDNGIKKFHNGEIIQHI